MHATRGSKAWTRGGAQGTAVSRVFGYYEGVPIETVWWSRDHAEASVDALVAGEPSSAADALVYGVALRTVGLLEAWQTRLAVYPEELACCADRSCGVDLGRFRADWSPDHRGGRARGLRWSSVLLDDALRVLRIVYVLNRLCEPTTKRLALRVQPLPVKPERFAERIEQTLTEPDPLRALLVMSEELQADVLALAPSGPNVDRARRWVQDAIDVLRGS